jgi:myosin heavy subunit
MFSFLKNLLGVKADQAVKSGMEALVRWDPKAATDAELRTMEQHLDQLGREVAQARVSFEKEQKEADAIVALYNQRLAAAEQLSAQAQSAEGSRKADLESSLVKLLEMLEQMAPDIEREKQDAVDAKAFLASMQETYDAAGTKLREARTELERAQRDMKRAEQQRGAAERQADAARRAAGLAQATDGLGVALKAMKEASERDRIEAEAQMAKARLLAVSNPEKADANIEAAMKAAKGGSPAIAGGDLNARLAALRGPSAQAALPKPE